MGGYSVMTIVVLVTVVYFVVHYMFASLTAHTTALLPVLLTAAIAVPEMPVKLISLLFCYTLGLIFGAIHLAVLLLIGIPYLRLYLG